MVEELRPKVILISDDQAIVTFPPDYRITRQAAQEMKRVVEEQMRTHGTMVLSPEFDLEDKRQPHKELYDRVEALEAWREYMENKDYNEQ